MNSLLSADAQHEYLQWFAYVCPFLTYNIFFISSNFMPKLP